MNKINNLCQQIRSRWTHRGKQRRCHPQFRPSVEPLEQRQLLAAQVFTSAPIQVRDSGEFAIVYSAVNDSGIHDNSIKTTGVSLRMHYDSSKVAPDIDAIISSSYSGATIQDTADLAEHDANPTTDRFVNFLWFDFQTGFPQDDDLPLVLFSAKFDSVDGFSGQSTISFTGSPPLGFDLQAEPVLIDFGTTNQQPIITSPASVSVREHVDQAVQLVATDANQDVITYAITGGADQAAFRIDSKTGLVSFVSAPDYANPSDSDQDNVYNIQVTATDGFGGKATQDIHIKVTNAAWINFQNVYDVNARDGVSALDALLIINELGRRAFSDPATNLLLPRRPVGVEFYYDVTADGKITALDALRVINQLARQRSANGEGALDSSLESASALAFGDASMIPGGNRLVGISVFDDTSATWANSLENVLF
jgi:hypothetical protein